MRKQPLSSPYLLAALLSALAACGSPAAEPSDTENPDSADPGDTPGENGGGNGGTGGGTQDPRDPDPLPGTPTLDLSTIVDFPAGVTVASPVSSGAGAPGAMGPGPNPPQPPPPQGASRTFGLLRLQAQQLPPPPPPGDAPPPPDGGVQEPDPNTAPPPPPGGAYQMSAAAVAGVLSGERSIASAFNLQSFFMRAGNANCYGPSLRWENHPDSSGPDAASGQLPGGDLGIWEPTTESGEACAAAQLNARMRDVESQVGMGLIGLAGLVAAYQSDGSTWPDDVAPGDSVDLTAAMEAAAIDRVSFNSATMTRAASGDAWSYVLDMEYGTPDGGSKSIVLRLEHSVTDREAGAYEGLLSYLIEDEYTDRNCRERPTGEVTLNGSVHYIKASASAVVLQARNATACGLASADPSADLLSDPVTSGVLEGNTVSPSAAWADNFNVFTAEFNPENLLGNYAYSWQAGSGDSHTRVLEVGLETEAGGEAYFGFGDRVQTSLGGQIKGFICNWAGPGNQHNGPEFAKYAQRQALTLDTATHRYISDAASSDITYAPTSSCMYDGAGSFVYDRNLNNDLSDESAETAAVMQSGTTLGFDLMSVADGEASIWDHIVARGYDLPSYP